MDPETRVEQTVVQELLEQQVAVVGGAGDQVLGQPEEGVQEVRGQVLPAGAGQQVGDHQEAPARDHLVTEELRDFRIGNTALWEIRRT